MIALKKYFPRFIHIKSLLYVYLPLLMFKLYYTIAAFIYQTLYNNNKYRINNYNGKEGANIFGWDSAPY